ncbi:OsmC family protein [Xanthobacter versatilis]|uniref:OsmC family protein n=1 Tax=Xanthobacter autotrophicus (strain ATCC BAA-1158 / Py2) TaxID=78245 RepID=A7II49_XANP2|nr:OsmC family protein [Xanthobacter autotrophicus Py2]
MAIIRTGSAQWSGGIKDGKGAISTESGALSAYPYGFASRFENQKGSNPEELLGAAHAACFTMALSLILGGAGLTATDLQTSAKVSLEKKEAGYEITAVDLTLTGIVPGATPEQFAELADTAKANCPLSKVIRAAISLDATLKS